MLSALRREQEPRQTPVTIEYEGPPKARVLSKCDGVVPIHDGAYRSGQLDQPRAFRSSPNIPHSARWSDETKSANGKTTSETCRRESVGKKQLYRFVGSPLLPKCACWGPYFVTGRVRYARIML
jgi:hypothetical protein